MQKILLLTSQSGGTAPALFLISKAKKAFLIPFSTQASSLSAALYLSSPPPLLSPLAAPEGRQHPLSCMWGRPRPCSGLWLESVMLPSVKLGRKNWCWD